MTIQEQLSRYLTAEAKIRNLSEQLESLRALRDNVTGSGDGVRPAGVTDRTGRVASMIADIEQLLEAEIADALRIKTRVLKMISGLTDADQYAVIYAKYIDGKSWTEIANSLYMSRNRAHRLHNSAIEALKKDRMEHNGTE